MRSSVQTNLDEGDAREHLNGSLQVGVFSTSPVARFASPMLIGLIDRKSGHRRALFASGHILAGMRSRCAMSAVGTSSGRPNPIPALIPMASPANPVSATAPASAPPARPACP